MRFQQYVSPPYINSGVLTTIQIIIAGVINGHVSAKSVYVRIFRGTDHMHKRSWIAVGSWTAIVLALWVLAWIIAEAIPVFNKLLSLVVCLTRLFLIVPVQVKGNLTIYRLRSSPVGSLSA